MSPLAAYIISLSFGVLVFAAFIIAVLKLVNFIGNRFKLSNEARQFIAFGAGFITYKVLLTSWLMPVIVYVFGE